METQNSLLVKMPCPTRMYSCKTGVKSTGIYVFEQLVKTILMIVEYFYPFCPAEANDKFAKKKKTLALQ